MTSIKDLFLRINQLKEDLQFILNIVNNEEYTESYRLQIIRIHLNNMLEGYTKDDNKWIPIK